MGNPFVHVELMSTNVGKAKAFYGKLFDWKLEDMEIDVCCLRDCRRPQGRHREGLVSRRDHQQ